MSQALKVLKEAGQINQGGNGTRGLLDLKRGGSATPAGIKMQTANGAVHVLFIEDDGTVKVYTPTSTQPLPAANSDGAVVGAQT